MVEGSFSRRRRFLQDSGYLPPDETQLSFITFLLLPFGVIGSLKRFAVNEDLSQRCTESCVFVRVRLAAGMVFQS